MKDSQIFKKTMPFIWARFFTMLAISGVSIVASLILLFIAIALPGIGTIIALILFIGLSVFFVRACEYFNYMVKSAHIAVIGELANNGTVPEGKSMIQYGKDKVKERFIAANAFIALDKLTTGACKQINNGINKVLSFFESIPGLKEVQSILNMFINIFLGYVDEAVLSHIFQSEKSESAWKGAADGLVLYFQNWKELAKNAGKIILFEILALGGLAIIEYAAAYSFIFFLFDATSIILYIVVIFIVILITTTIKDSFIDSYVTISVINKYNQLAKQSTLQYDLYEKCKSVSSSFRKICNNAGDTAPAPTTQTVSNTIAEGMASVATSAVAAITNSVQPQAPVEQPVQPQAPVAAPVAEQPQQTPVAQAPVVEQVQQAPVNNTVPGQTVYCTNCGAPMAANSNFCTSCGNKKA